MPKPKKNKLKKSDIDRMWAPWRLAYVQKPTTQKEKGCMFCTKHRSRRDAQNYIIERGKHVFALLNIYPYNNGHLMIAPYRHVSELEELNDDERLEMMKMLSEIKKRLEKLLKPHGFNVGINCGTVAGAGIADHMHMHIVPRWNGDTNFMPVFANVKVIPQSLDALYKALSNA